MPHDTAETELTGGGSTAVHRRGDVVLRQARPWSKTVLLLLRHLEAEGFTAAPRVIGGGLDSDGRETLSFIEGQSPQGAWTDEAAAAVGRMLRDLHRATATFRPPPEPVWLPWWGRDLGGTQPIIGHCDSAPWNILARDGRPVALIDWDTAGPVDLRWEVAQTVWLNAQLHDDDVAARVGLPDARARARQVRLIADGYGLSARERAGLVDAMIELAVRSAAQEAIDGGVRPEGTNPAPMGLLGGGPPLTGHGLLWAVAWRTRSAAWMLRHRATLECALR